MLIYREKNIPENVIYLCSSSIYYVLYFATFDPFRDVVPQYANFRCNTLGIIIVVLYSHILKQIQ